MIDTFVLAQIRPEVALTSFRSRLYHLRSRDARHEIDLIVELSGGDVVAVEIKATAAPKRSDARHIEWLREQLGERFLAGAVLHTGPRPFPILRAHLCAADRRALGGLYRRLPGLTGSGYAGTTAVHLSLPPIERQADRHGEDPAGGRAGARLRAARHRWPRSSCPSTAASASCCCSTPATTRWSARNSSAPIAMAPMILPRWTATVVGISSQDLDLHEGFIAKHGLDVLAAVGRRPAGGEELQRVLCDVSGSSAR